MQNRPSFHPCAKYSRKKFLHIVTYHQYHQGYSCQKAEILTFCLPPLSPWLFLGNTDHLCHSVILVRTVGNENILFLLKCMWVLSKVSQTEIQQSFHHWEVLKQLWSASSLCSPRGVTSTLTCLCGPSSERQTFTGEMEKARCRAECMLINP